MNEDIIISSLFSAVATIIVGLLVQGMRNAQKNKNYLRKKFGGQLQSLVSSVTVMCNHLDKALSPWNETKIDYQVIHGCFEEMKRQQSSIYLIGKKGLISSFNDLFNSLDFIEDHSHNTDWYLNVRMRCNELPSLSGKLLKEITFLQGY